MEQWKSNQVHNEVDDTGQGVISLHWIINSKIIDNKPSTKAHLCACGFKEQN